MLEEATTKPTLETVLERINALNDKFDSFREEVETRFDRLESVAHQTRADLMTLRLDFKEVRAQLKKTA